MGYPGRHNIYEAAIRRMVTQALEAQEEEFRKEHAADTDEQLLAYLRSCAMSLHHSPWPREITGGVMIKDRFGSWSRALSLARLPAPKTANQYKSFSRVQKEVEKQKDVYRQRKAEKKVLAANRRTQQADKKKQSD